MLLQSTFILQEISSHTRLSYNVSQEDIRIPENVRFIVFV